MGHLRLGRLPRTQKWREVIDLVANGGSAAQVADATIEASESQFFDAAADSGVVHSVWLLTCLPDAARSEDFASALRSLGIQVSDLPSTVELTTALGEAVNEHLSALRRPRTDIAEMARLSAIETLASVVQVPTASLFGTEPDDLQRAIGRLATEKQFGGVARDFFARLTERVLTYYVSRELPLHVGHDRRFSTLDHQRKFQDAVALHARQAARIVEEFAGGWYSKARHEGDLTPERTSRFVAYAMKKLRGELRRGVE